MMMAVKLMRTHHVDAVLSINNNAFLGRDRWDKEELDAMERTRGVEILVLMDCHETVYGFAVIKKSPKSIQIVRIAIHQHMRRAGVGRALVGFIKSKLSRGGQTMIWFDLSDRLLPGAHRWAVACGFEIESRHNRNTTRFTFDMPVMAVA